MSMQIYETFVNQTKIGENMDLYRTYIGVAPSKINPPKAK